MIKRLVHLGVCVFVVCFCQVAESAIAGKAGGDELVVASNGKCDAIIVVSPKAQRKGNDLLRDPSPTKFERFAAEDLARCIGLMTGAKPKIADTPQAISSALKENRRPVLIVGSEVFKVDSSIKQLLRKAAKKKPILRAEAIIVRRRGNRVYLAGLTDDGHYHAVAELLHRWGCRWYFPTEFGECIPRYDILKIGELDYVYAPPFEIRNYWISWNGSYKGYIEFKLRNMMTIGLPYISTGHNLGNLTKELVPKGKTIFNVPIAEERTAKHVAKKVISQLKKGKRNSVSLSMSDGIYESDSPVDKELQSGIFDKYFLAPWMTDVFMTLYNRVCEIIEKENPGLNPRLGFLAYSNMTIPPQKVLRAHRFLFCELAPIDIDPVHSMDSEVSPQKQEYREIMYRWAKIMEGRLIIYDYDQGMLVWRNIPNPSHQAFKVDVKHYARAGILGIKTESRGAIATTFLNLHLRGLLMWNPQADIDSHLKEFYHIFYGPAAEPMEKYWSAIFKAWEETIVTEHEFFVIPAIYTPELVGKLRKYLIEAESVMQKYSKRHPSEKLTKRYLERMRFTRLGFEVLDNYIKMIAAGASNCDFRAAVSAGKTGLKKLKELAMMNPTFTTRVVGRVKLPDYGGSPAWWPGEVKYYEDLMKLTDGSEGKLLMVLPLKWAFHRDPNDTGLMRGWAYKDKIDLSYWNKHKEQINILNRKDYPITEWEILRTDLYMQAQGILHPDWQSFRGYAWYRTVIDLKEADVRKNVHICFPGLFGKAWLYINGRLVKFRPQQSLWWRNDYSFKWDVDLTGKLKAGKNLIVLRNLVEAHFGGIFRRPFLYVSVKK